MVSLRHPPNAHVGSTGELIPTVPSASSRAMTRSARSSRKATGTGVTGAAPAIARLGVDTPGWFWRHLRRRRQVQSPRRKRQPSYVTQKERGRAEQGNRRPWHKLLPALCSPCRQRKASSGDSPITAQYRHLIYFIETMLFHRKRFH
ncbi:hypothetical protein BHE74_00001888 [Ensete ventricosum]|nr:hypothetical protein BHE74_00001888 [Ensete ventricosum]